MPKAEGYVRFILLAGSALTAIPALAGELPTGGKVVHGRVDISTPSAKAMTIRQDSRNAIVNWKGFSIGEGARVDIRQPSRRAAILNRVTGDTPSSIGGRLTANGQVFLVNPNGIAIGPNGTVDTGSFVASTLGTSDADFLAGKRVFTGDGASAPVVNEGRIRIGRGGYGALLGGRVENSGTVDVKLGRIGMASGEKVTLDASEDGFLQVAVPTAGEGDAGALIEMSGRVSAEGGRVEMKAAVARDAARRAVNLSGVVEARSVGGVSGNIVLGGGGGAVRVSGRLDARAPAREALVAAEPPARRPAKGGGITVTGGEVTLAGATLDASGLDGGGSIRVGGGYQGGGKLRRADTTMVDARSRLRADALGAGDGGRVIVWSDERTDFAGRLTARGGTTGDGGFAEVSGKAELAFSGDVDLSAPNGRFGTLLLDPFNVFIEDGPQRGIVNDDNELQPTVDDSVINAATLEGLLDTANVIVDTDTETGDQEGNITVGAPLSWDATTGLFLLAEGDIVIAQPITAQEGALGLSAEGQITTPTTWVDSTGTVQSGGNGAINVGIFALGNGDWVQNSATLPAFSAADFRIEDSEGGEPSFLRALGGNGTPDAPYLITDVYGLQGVGSAAEIGAGLPDLADSYALANAIDANITSGWNDVEGAEGFEPIGELFDLPTFDGTFRGNGFAIDGLFIDRPSESAGLFEGVGDDGTIDNVLLTDVSITGGALTGALVAENDGAISRARVVRGTVAAAGPDGGLDVIVGGLVGQNGGTVIHSFSTASVSGTAAAEAEVWAGGLIGQNDGAVSLSSASGAVAVLDAGDFQHLGGLVGENTGSISQSYATGPTTAAFGNFDMGGLVGANSGEISETYATGLVADGADIPNGGLVGVNVGEGTVTASFWDIDTTGQDESAGGTGLATDDFQNAAVFMPLAEAAGWSFETTWASPSAEFYPELYAIAPVVRVDVDDKTRQYGLDNPPLTSTNFGGPDDYVFGPPGDSLDVAALLTTPADPTSDVGAYPITTSAGEATSPGGIVYRLVITDGEMVVTQAPLIVAANDQSKTYGPTFVFDGTEFTTDPRQLFNDDRIDSVTLASEGAPGTADVGSYVIDISAAEGEGIENYAITYRPGNFVVAHAAVDVIADDQTKTYGATFVFDGTEFTTDPRRLFNDDRIDSVTLASEGAPGTADVGSYAIDIGDAVGAGLENYVLKYVPGELVVTPAPLTVTADSRSKRYGQRLVFNGTEFTTRGLLNADTVDTVTLSSDGAPAEANVGSYPIEASDAEGSGLSNYVITYGDGRLDVTPAPLRITADDQVKIQGETFVFDGTEFSADGLVNGDRIDFVALRSRGARADARAANSPFTIRASDARPAEVIANYDVSYVDGRMDVVPPAARPPIPGAIIPPEAGNPGNLVETYTLPNPRDTIVLAVAGDGGLGEGGAAGGPIVDRGQELETAEQMLEYLETLASALEDGVADCRSARPDTIEFLACVDAALGDYAARLDDRVVDLPEPLRQVSAVIRNASRSIAATRATAARRIAEAGSAEEVAAIEREAAAEARAAVQGAITEVRRQIALIRVDDSEIAQLQLQQGQAIAGALERVDAGLLRAVEL